jgi:hypothetical protein
MNRRKFLETSILGAAPLVSARPERILGAAAEEGHAQVLPNSRYSPSLVHPPLPQMEPRLPRIEAIWYEPAVPVGLQKQLLVDDFVISHRFNIHRELLPAKKANESRPVLVKDRTWEDPNYIQVKSVFRDQDKFRMWYWGREWGSAYAESDDGFKWVKPNLGIHEFQGSRNNNLIDLCESCYLDPHETEPAHRYKAAHHPAKPPYGVCLAHSADGYRWTPYNRGEPVTYRAADTLNQIIWDEDARLYRLFTRTDFGTGGGDTEYRGAREMVNPDVRANPTNWLTVDNWKFDRQGQFEVARRQVHTLNLWIHEGIHFGLLCVYEWPAAGTIVEVNDYQRRHERDVWNFYIATRRGGHRSNWDMSWVYADKPLIQRGQEGSFDKDLIHASSTVITWNDQHWIYYSGFPLGHFRSPSGPYDISGSIGLALVKLDRLIFLEPWSREDGGWMTTKPFKVEGNTLEVNADSQRGWVAAEALDSMGQPIPGFTLQDAQTIENQDGLRLQLQWKNQRSLAALRGQIVRLKFHLRNTKLYAFQIKA